MQVTHPASFFIVLPLSTAGGYEYSREGGGMRTRVKGGELLRYVLGMGGDYRNVYGDVCELL